MTKIIAITTLTVAILVSVLAGDDQNGRECCPRRLRGLELPPEKILLLIRDFHRQVFWTAYQNLDPVLERIDRQGGSRGAVR